MTELKTLEDLDYECTLDHEKLYSELKLRVEAIKWIKEIEFQQERTDVNDGVKIQGIHIEPCGEYRCDAVSDWIKHFFNITEEDLK